MGLDMYAFATQHAPTKPVDFKSAGDEQIHAWRKHPNLHGWMEQLYRAKGGRARTFNCVNLLLTDDDLNVLERAVRDGILPATEGFFFGESDGSEQESDLEFVAKARAAITSGLSVYYSSWW